MIGRFLKYVIICTLLVAIFFIYYNGYPNNLPQSTATEGTGQIPILMYHHISENPKLWSEATISPEKFREDMLYLKALDYEGIHFKDYISYIEKGTDLPPNPIFITFDDGYLSNYEYAYPILKELDMKATFSVIGWCRGRSYRLDNVTKIIDHFSWEQALEMYNTGIIDIQHHTYDLHSTGDNITVGKGVGMIPNEDVATYTKRFIEDTNKLKKIIEEEVENEVLVFTYPFGVYNNITEASLKELGFKVTLTTKDGISDLSQGLFELKRINMPSEVSSPELMKKITRLQKRSVEIPFLNISDPTERISKLEGLLKLKK